MKRRDGYREAFKEFNPSVCANLSDEYLENLLTNPNIIRNRLKVFSTRKNAQVFINIQKEFGSFDAYVWQFVQGKTKINRPQSMQEVPALTKESDALSKDLKKKGMSFVGSTIMYAYMQAVGMVDDHIKECFRFNSQIDK